MNRPPIDPTARDGEPVNEPRLLPSIDPASPTGRRLRETLGRLSGSAAASPELQRAAQDVLAGRQSLRGLMSSAAFQPAMAEAARRLTELNESMDEEQRAEFRAALREGRLPEMPDSPQRNATGQPHAENRRFGRGLR